MEIILIIAWTLFKLFLVVTVVWTVISYLIKPAPEFDSNVNRWHHFFEGESFSTQEIYKSILTLIKSKNIDDIHYHEVWHRKRGLLSSERLYLHLIRDNQLAIVCAAPFGNGFFISWWCGDKVNRWADFAARIPYVGEKFERMFRSKSLFQMDTNSMFTAAVKSCVMEVVDQLNSSQGSRPLSELERRPVELHWSKS